MIPRNKSDTDSANCNENDHYNVDCAMNKKIIVLYLWNIMYWIVWSIIACVVFCYVLNVNTDYLAIDNNWSGYIKCYSKMDFEKNYTKNRC